MGQGKSQKMHELIRLMSRPSGVEREEAQEELGISERTFFRYVDHLRDEGYDIDCERGDQRYRIPEGAGLSRMELEDAELTAVGLMRQFFEVQGMFPTGSEGLQLVERILQGATSDPERTAQDLKQFILLEQKYRPIIPSKQAGVFKKLLSRLRGRESVKIAYRKPGEVSAPLREVEPYGLILVRGQWVMLALDRKDRELKNFYLHRILQVHPAGRQFTIPEDFSLQEFFKNSWGFFVYGDPNSTVEVKVLVEPGWTHLVSETMWHPSQTTRMLDDGWMEATFKLNCVEEIKLWIMSNGAHMKAVAPPELVESLRKDVRRMTEFYKGGADW